MRFLSIGWVALGLACELAAAKSLLHDSGNLHRRHDPLEEHVRREALEFIDAELERRQEISHNAAPVPAPSSSTSSSGPPANLNDPALNKTIATACLGALADITKVSNAAGWAACYNILFLNNQTGIFEADLRLYQVSPPSGSFAGVKSSNIHIALNYPKAGISATSQPAKRAELGTRQANNTMGQLQQYSFVGQINPGLTLTNLKSTDLMALVIPSISLYAESPRTNTIVSTNLTSASIAFFTTGIFRGQGASAAAAAQPSAVALAAQKAAAFTLPGTTIGIFPIGGIITGAWIVLFLTTFGLGTLGRIMSRREYRSHRSTAAPTPVETAKHNSVPPLRRLLSRKVSSSKRPRLDAAPARKESKSKKNPPLTPVVEMVSYEITYDKTFGERPNYYLEHLPTSSINRQI